MTAPNRKCLKRVFGLISGIVLVYIICAEIVSRNKIVIGSSLQPMAPMQTFSRDIQDMTTAQVTTLSNVSSENNRTQKQNLTNSVQKSPRVTKIPYKTYKALTLMNYHKAKQETSQLAQIIRDYFIISPSREDYNLDEPDITDYSNGQSPIVDRILNEMVCKELLRVNRTHDPVFNFRFWRIWG